MSSTRRQRGAWKLAEVNKSMSDSEWATARHQFPAEHWAELAPFVTGDRQDPKGLFCLADDVWEAWPYATNGRPTEAIRYRFCFGALQSFLKPYVKLYCYERLVGGGEGLSQETA